MLERKADFQNETAPAAALLEELVGGVYPEKVKLLGQRTGELHLALASRSDDPAFAPEPFNAMAQRSVYQSMRTSLRRAFTSLEKKLSDVPAKFRSEAREVLPQKKKYWRAKNDYSIVERTPRKSGFTATTIWGNWFIPAKIS